MNDPTTKDRKISSVSLTQRDACLDHSRNLIAAARRVLGEDAAYPNLAYHLGVLALEELGKAGLIISRAMAEGHRDNRWTDKRLDDHTFKLMWALWSPVMLDGRIEPKKFEQAKEFARSTHARRLDALYVNHASGKEHVLNPKEAVSVEQALSTIDLADAHLEYEAGREIIAIPQNDELLDWFWKTVGNEDGSTRIFSGPFINKLEEFGDDVRAWVEWAKREIEKIHEAEKQLLQAELSREPSSVDDANERWVIKIRLVSLWHTFQQKVLKIWNQNLPNAELQVRKGTNNKELLLTLRLSDSVRVDDLFDEALMRSKMLLTALNIGSAGYIWYDVSDQSQNFFESVEDLENPKHKLKIQKSVGASSLRLKILEDGEWRASETMQEPYVRNALNCAAAFFSISDEQAGPIFGPYMQGLALLSMTNFHVSCDDQALASFEDCLSNALKHFSEWNGAGESKRKIFHEVLSDAVKEEDHRDMMIDWDMHDGQKDENKIRTVFHLKRLADLYLTIVARRICVEQFRGT